MIKISKFTHLIILFNSLYSLFALGFLIIMLAAAVCSCLYCCCLSNHLTLPPCLPNCQHFPLILYFQPLYWLQRALSQRFFEANWLSYWTHFRSFASWPSVKLSQSWSVSCLAPGPFLCSWGCSIEGFVWLFVEVADTTRLSSLRLGCTGLVFGAGYSSLSLLLSIWTWVCNLSCWNGSFEADALQRIHFG